MHTIRKATLLSGLLIFIFAIIGCSETKNKIESATAQTPNPKLAQQAETTGNRFQTTAPQGPSAVERALELSEKCAALEKQKNQLEQTIQLLTTENKNTKNQLETAQKNLKQAEKEITEANELLIKMRIELNNWKTNILGFQDEMRQADQAQLEALLKIMKVLGAEEQTSPTRTNTPPANTPPNQPVKENN